MDVEQKILEKAKTHKEVSKITKVEDGGKNYFITKSDGWSFGGIPKSAGIVPKVDDEIAMYGQPFQTVQGVDIAGKEVFFKTQAELDAEHEAFCKKFREDNWKEYRATIERIKNDAPFETIDISGMSGSYEWGCQVMLRAGLAFLKKHKDFHFDYEQSPHIIGVATTDTPWGKELDKVVTEAPTKFGEQYGCTGAMHQAVINHLMRIHKDGYSKWLKSFPASRRYKYPNIPPPKD